MRRPWDLVVIGLLVIRVTTAWGEGDGSPPRSARDRIGEWVKSGNRFGPESRVVLHVHSVVDDRIDKVNNVAITLGSGIVRSGKTTLLHVWAGEFFVFELTDTQAAALGAGPNGVSVSTGMTHKDTRVRPARVRLGPAAIVNVEELDGAGRIEGRVSFQVLEASREKIAIRLSYSKDASTTSRFQHLDAGLPGNCGDLNFSFEGVNSDSGAGDRPY